MLLLDEIAYQTIQYLHMGYSENVLPFTDNKNQLKNLCGLRTRDFGQ